MKRKKKKKTTNNNTIWPLTTTTAAKTACATKIALPSSVGNSGAQTLTRIGSIGRTTIACITTSNNNDAHALLNNNGNSVGVVSAAALAAAGVELDSVEDSLTEVIVKIENTATSSEAEDEEDDGGEGDGDAGTEGEEHEPEVEMEPAEDAGVDMPPTNATNNSDADDERDYNNFDLKLSSPMSWAYDAVKIENDDDEEFEELLLGEQDNTEDDDDLLTTAAATTKHSASVKTDGRTLKCKGLMIRPRHGALAKRRQQQQQKQNDQQMQQQQRLLLEQQQHLHHLQLQPNQQRTLQIKLPTIPATITSITPVASYDNAANANNNNSSNSNNNNNNNNNGNGGVTSATTSPKGADFKSSVSDDKRYRILIQNQRMRKESLEHSEDMIYNADIEKPWVCRNCNRNYKWKNSLKCHLKNECGQPPRYFCSKLCGYATNVHSNLKRHLNTKCRDRMDDDQKSSNSQTTNGSGAAATAAVSSSSYTLVLQKNE